MGILAPQPVSLQYSTVLEMKTNRILGSPHTRRQESGEWFENLRVQFSQRVYTGLVSRIFAITVLRGNS